jgi:hypothetical protein
MADVQPRCPECGGRRGSGASTAFVGKRDEPFGYDRSPLLVGAIALLVLALVCAALWWFCG